MSITQTVASDVAGVRIEETFDDGFAGRPSPVSETTQLFEVRYRDKVARIRANDDREAWAKFCDHEKMWPSPKTAIVLLVEGAKLTPVYNKALYDQQLRENAAELQAAAAKIKAEAEQAAALAESAKQSLKEFDDQKQGEQGDAETKKPKGSK